MRMRPDFLDSPRPELDPTSSPLPRPHGCAFLDSQQTGGHPDGQTFLYHLWVRFAGDCLGGVQEDLNLDAGTEPIDDRHESIYGEAAEVRVADAGEVGGRSAGAGVGCANRQAFTAEHLDDFSRENRLELFGVGVIMRQVAEYGAASP